MASMALAIVLSAVHAEDRGFEPDIPGLGEEVEARNVGQADVDNGEVPFPGLQRSEPGPAVGVGFDPVPGTFEGAGQDEANRFLVLDDEDPCLAHASGFAATGRIT